jgi:hypothetical protein
MGIFSSYRKLINKDSPRIELLHSIVMYSTLICTFMYPIDNNEDLKRIHFIILLILAVGFISLSIVVLPMQWIRIKKKEKQDGKDEAE